ncbi:phenol 2-monooxygenase [Streptomyces sp. GC420]|uniref:phenol 2-monooxygenase n=1 Tax=Streptomyces sp. GC420 TaxID=2697568 RepID=UPI0014151E1E|nr:phenol 2-monooxygenase [Streptomyces sp. GC420]NBM16142.1 phenol 2-monooxygenase [Streptomyces sp. GC420]
MQYELRTQVIEPRRKTFQYLIDRYGDRPASRYEEGTIDVQPTEHFHYRPLWAPDKELYDESWSTFRLTDPYSFTDPRQYYYAPYVTARASLHDAFARTLDYLGSRDLLARLPEPWRELIGQTVLPLRHYESGAQMVSTAAARFCYGATIAQCCAFAAFDRVGNAQIISRVGIALGGGTAGLLQDAKQTWLDAPALQPLRRYVEELLVEEDWAAAMIGQDLADRLVYALLYRRLDEAALLGGAGGYSLVAQHLSGWFADHSRWLDALYTAWLADPEHGAANGAELAAVVERLLPAAAEAVGALADAADGLVDAGCRSAVEEAAAAVRTALSAAGAPIKEQSA